MICQRRRSDDEWLEECSMLTDDEFKEAIDVELTDDKCLERIVESVVHNTRKRSKA